MRIAGVLGLLFALVFGVFAFGGVLDLHSNTAGNVTGGAKSLVDAFPMFWGLLLAAIALVGIVAAALHLAEK